MNPRPMSLLVVLLACAFHPALAAQGADAQNPVDANRVVAVVNGDEIKGGEYYRRMEYLPGVGMLVGTSMIEFPPGLLTLDRLITERLTMQLAARLGVTPKEDQVDMAYRDAINNDPKLEKQWTDGGGTLDQLRTQVRLREAQFNIVTAGINVTDQEVQDEYDKNHDRYSVPKLVDLRVIVCDNVKDMAAVDADLAAGKPFADVAKDRSMDITKVRGGDLGPLPLASLDADTRQAIAAIKIGQTTGWVKVPKQADDGKLMERIDYVSATDAKLHPLDDALKASIRKNLMWERGSVKNDFHTLLKAELKQAKVDIKDPVFQKAWATFQTRLNEVESAKTPPAGGG